MGTAAYSMVPWRGALRIRSTVRPGGNGVPIITTVSSPAHGLCENRGTLKAIKASYVFLDAVVFVEGNFDYDSPRFKSLTQLANGDRIQVFLTDLTLREIKANLARGIERAVSKRVEPILRNSSLPEVRQLFRDLDATKILRELTRQLDAFLQTAKVEILDVEPSALAPVLDAYFGQRAPFGPGKNKAEFPDAITLQTLKGWCERTGRIMAVVSHDAAVREACLAHESLHHFEDLAKYLDAVASENERLSSFVRKMVLEREEEILTRAAKAFPWLGAYVTDVDGEVDEVIATDVSITRDPDDIEILSLTHEHAVVELSANFAFSAELSYDKPGTGSWDSEDKMMLFADRVDETVEREDERNIVAEVQFRGVSTRSFRVVDVRVEGPDLAIRSDHDNDWP